MLGTRILEKRLALKMGQKDLAQKAGISVTYLSQLERNKSVPSARVCVDIANALCVPMDYLLQDTEGGRMYRLSEYSRRIQRLKADDRRLILLIVKTMLKNLD